MLFSLFDLLVNLRGVWHWIDADFDLFGFIKSKSHVSSLKMLLWFACSLFKLVLSMKLRGMQ